jgi:DNA-binding transcriptional MerR regulator
MLHCVDDLMSIGEFSVRSGLSPKRLRSYAAGGLLVPAAVDSTSGYRYYSLGQLHEAQLIDSLRDAGGPLADIAAVLRDPSCDQLDVWARRVETDAAHRQEGLDLARRLLSIDARSFIPVDSVGPDVELDSAAHAVMEGDRLLVGTDGLFNEVPNDEIASLMAATVDLRATADALVELALSRGGRDNISVVVAEVNA